MNRIAKHPTWQALEGDDIVSETPQEAYLVEQLRMAGTPDTRLKAIFVYHRGVADRQPLSRTLLELGIAGDTAVARWIAEHNGYPLLGPQELRASRSASRLLPEAIARTRQALPLESDDGDLWVVIADPEAPQFNQVRYALEGHRVRWIVSPHADVMVKIAEAYARAVDLRDNEVERFVEDMLREAALTRGVSDIHCIPDERSVDIRWRVDGELVPWRVIPGERKELFVAQVKLSSARGSDGQKRTAAAPTGLDVANKLETQDASSVREYGSKRIALRYSVIPAICGESIVIRILDQDAQVESLESLGMAADLALSFREALLQKNGLILITGPTGHGKSTTLAAAIPALNARSQRILSVEDPVEYRLRNVTQFPVTARLSWASALRAFLRHNPDIIIVGEIRDAETAELAIRLALTGHLILATVHATTAIQAISRLIDLGIPGSLLTATVRLLLGQRLVRRICPGCRKPHRHSGRIAQEHAELLAGAGAAGLVPADDPEVGFHEAGGGCAACQRSGYVGRVGIFEHRWISRGVAEVLGAGGFNPVAAEREFEGEFLRGALGARTMRSDGLIKAALGLVSWEEVLANTALASL